jgi:pimeloyl-ACP methyl ester carboxylesterase
MFVYLHGFASGPGSTKAQFFRRRCAAVGIDLVVPDLAPDFTRMTIATQLAIIEALLDDVGPHVLMGSSLGGYLAALVAERRPQAVRGLVLFAPAFGFAARWEERVGEKAMRRWRSSGSAPVYHYARQREEPLSIDLLDDARRWPPEPSPSCAAMVFAGRRDDAVPLPAVEGFCTRDPARTLVVHDAGHELTEVLEPMWERTLAFLGDLGVLPSAA